MHNWNAAVFDLDGVLTDTAKYHFLAWKLTMENLGIPVDEEVNELVKGISRQDSLQLILDRANVPMNRTTFHELLEKKNDLYLELIQNLNEDDVLPGIVAFLQELRSHGIPCVVASASKSAPMILDRLHIRSYFVGVVDPRSVAQGKPAPDIFLKACEMVNIPVEEAVGFEDARAGVQAIKSAGMVAIGIGHENLKEVDPDGYYPSTKNLCYQEIKQLMEGYVS